MYHVSCVVCHVSCVMCHEGDRLTLDTLHLTLLAQPTLAPLVMFHITVAFAFANGRQAQVKLFNIRILRELFRCPIQDDAAPVSIT